MPDTKCSAYLLILGLRALGGVCNYFPSVTDKEAKAKCLWDVREVTWFGSPVATLGPPQYSTDVEHTAWLPGVRAAKQRSAQPTSR